MKYVFLTISLVLLLLSSTNAQTKTTVDVRQLWTGYFNQTRLTDKWGLWTDVHLRTKDNYFNNLSQGIIRFGLTYYLNDDAKLTAGYAYVNHFPSDNHTNISQPEHRPWQQIQWHTKYPGSRRNSCLIMEPTNKADCPGKETKKRQSGCIRIATIR